MDKAYKFVQITLLGLMLGAIIVLLLQINYWALDLKMTIRKSVVHQNNEFIKEGRGKKLNKPPVFRIPNEPKFKI